MDHVSRLPSSSPPPAGYTDTAIDTPTADRFGYLSYAAVLADLIDQADTPITIGIYGFWGSGKTSLMRLLWAQLNQPARAKAGSYHTLWINVWQLSSRDEVWQAFLQALFSRVHKELSLWQRLDKMKLLNQLARNLLRALLVAAPLVLAQILGRSEITLDQAAEDAIARGGLLATLGIGLWWLGRAKPIVEAIRQTTSLDLSEVLTYAPYEAQVTTLMQMQDQFDGMVKALVGQRGKLVIFIDDLDRCSPDKIPEILEAIKLFTTSKNCMYVLGVNHHIVSRAILDKYHFSEREAAEYLEKIVQIPFQLPPLERRRIAALVRHDYTDILEACPDAPEIFSVGLEPNPRKVKRELNIYRMLLNLAQVRQKSGEIDAIVEPLLGKMVVIQSRFRALYRHLLHDPGFLVDLELWAAHRDALGDPDDDRIPVQQDFPLGGFNRDEQEKAKQESLAAARAVRSRLDAPGNQPDEPLVPVADRALLASVLQVGDDRFGHLTSGQLHIYIYLTGTALGEAVIIEAARDLRPDLQQRLETSLAKFQRFFAGLGYRPKADARLRVSFGSTDVKNAWYMPAKNEITIGRDAADDLDVALGVYAQYVIQDALEGPLDEEDISSSMLGGIYSGLADYFTCSFTDDPHLAQLFAQKIGQPALRDLTTSKLFSDLPEDVNIWDLGEIWGATFWEIRQLLGAPQADRLVFAAWTSLTEDDLSGDLRLNFASRLLQANQHLRQGQQQPEVKAILQRRGLPLPTTDP
jgi:Cdc6-like AAA superfamily ATPase